MQRRRPRHLTCILAREIRSNCAGSHRRRFTMIYAARHMNRSDSVLLETLDFIARRCISVLQSANKEYGSLCRRDGMGITISAEWCAGVNAQPGTEMRDGACAACCDIGTKTRGQMRGKVAVQNWGSREGTSYKIICAERSAGIVSLFSSEMTRVCGQQRWWRKTRGAARARGSRDRDFSWLDGHALCPGSIQETGGDARADRDAPGLDRRRRAPAARPRRRRGCEQCAHTRARIRPLKAPPQTCSRARRAPPTCASRSPRMGTTRPATPSSSARPARTPTARASRRRSPPSSAATARPRRWCRHPRARPYLRLRER
jgi:hypothetical protein